MHRLTLIGILFFAITLPSFAIEHPVLSDLIKPKTAEAPSAVSHVSFAVSLEQRLVKFVRKTVDTLRYTAYKMGGTRFDTSRGVYVVDCSSYVDNVLATVSPDAYLDLVNTTGADRPNSKNYYNFFANLSGDDNHYWNKIDNVAELRPGDILVFRYKKRSMGGHVMVVMNKPVREMDSFLVQVADSSPSPHSEDTRASHSGVGIGTLLLKANPNTGAPAAYAWGMGARWDKNVRIAMGRPVDGEVPA